MKKNYRHLECIRIEVIKPNGVSFSNREYYTLSAAIKRAKLLRDKYPSYSVSIKLYAYTLSSVEEIYR